MQHDRLRLLVPTCLVLLLPLLGCGEGKDPAVKSALGESPSPTQVPAQSGLEHGLALFERNCAVCHGERGLGDGTASYLLSPKPRDFSAGRFLLGSNSSGLPVAADLRATLERGMPGSAMPPWDHLPSTDLDDLALAVGHLALEGRVWRFMEDDAELSESEAREIAAYQLETGEAVHVPPGPAVSDELIARGRTLYIEHCSKCHDEDGRGRKATDMVDEQGNRVLARDFTLGIFKGGSEPELIAMRILRGLHGSPMPANPMATEDLWPIVHFVRTLIPPGVEARVKLNQQTLTAKRSTSALTADVDGPAWGMAQTMFLPLTPLWWRPNRIEGVEVQALHDGSRLALRLRWADATKDDTQLSQQGFGDGAALGFSNAVDPPLFSMGSVAEPVSLWHWKATWARDLKAGSPTLQSAFPGMPDDGALNYPGHPGQDEFATASVVGNPLAQQVHANAVEVAQAVGFGSLTTLGAAAQKVESAARWAEGHWTVVLVRDLSTEAGSDVALAAGGRVAVSFALWDGSAGDRNGQKCVSIWHELELAP